MRDKETRKIVLVGSGFIAFGLFCNVSMFSMLFSQNGISSIYSKMGIWIIQVFFILAGVMIILKRKKISAAYKQARIDAKSKVFVGIIFLLVFLIGFAVPEMLLRFFKPQSTYSHLMKLVKAGIYAPSEFNPFTLKANVQTTTLSMENPGKDVEVVINSLGLRGEEITFKKPQEVKRVLILGDSYTYGVYVANHETYPAVLQGAFEKSGQNIQVINAGYADGWAPDEHYAWLVNRGLDFKPDIIIYGFFIGNDLVDTMDLEWHDLDGRGLPKKIINSKIRVDENGIIRSIQKDQKTAGTEGIYKIPFLRESHFLVFLFNRWNMVFSRMKVDPSNRAWGENPFPFIFNEINDVEMTYQEGRFKKLVLGMSEVAQENNAEFLILMIPINFQVDGNFLPRVLGTDKLKIQRNYFEEIKPWLKEYRIEYLDLLRAMKSESGDYYPENGEVHFNPQGHRFVAEKIKMKLDQLGWGRGHK